MKEFFLQLLSTKTDTPSVMRFAFLFQVIFSNVVVWYVWLFVCIWCRQIVDLPQGVVMAYAAANGISFMGKGFQRFAERRSFEQQDEEVIEVTAKSEEDVK